MNETFDTPTPITLYVEVGAGTVTVDAQEGATQTQVTVEGAASESTVIERRADHVVVQAPRRRAGLLGKDAHTTVTVTLPSRSKLITKLASADLVARGRFASTKVRSGSGDVRIDDLVADAVVECGSGDLELRNAEGDLRVKSGSGTVAVQRTQASAVISTGSGSVTLGIAEGETVVKSGSGDLRIGDAHTELSLNSASGDLTVGAMRRGTVQAKAVSGDVRIGVPAGIPVYTDVSSVTGRVTSDLQGAGRPGAGQEFVTVRASSVSGDIHLLERSGDLSAQH